MFNNFRYLLQNFLLAVLPVVKHVKFLFRIFACLITFKCTVMTSLNLCFSAIQSLEVIFRLVQSICHPLSLICISFAGKRPWVTTSGAANKKKIRVVLNPTSQEEHYIR